MDNNSNNLDSMSHISTKPWTLITNVSNATGYQYFRTTIGDEIGCPHDYVVTEYETEEDLATAIDLLEKKGFYMKPENRIPAETIEEDIERDNPNN